MDAHFKNLQHLSWRAGFGDLTVSNSTSIPKIVTEWLQQNDRSPVFIQVAQSQQLRELQGPGKSATEVEQRDYRRQRGKLNREGIKKLNDDWLQEMFAGDCPLREKMALFWHGHFACRIQNVSHQEQLLQFIRTHALDNFGTLLMGVSKSAAMLQFLDNQKNRKQHPNENFGREVMELFTMGRGNYTEHDVKEGSRAFTGWTFDQKGDFVLKEKFHDDGQKTFLGKTGPFTGEEVLGMLLDHQATAKHISGKLYQFLVNDIPDPKRVDEMATVFYKANYDMKTLLTHVFTANWFYAPENRGSRIKSPIELLVGMQRSIPVHYQNENALILFQRIMGQTLFYPPNVAGWPGGNSWIDNTTLMFRMRLPQIMYYAEDLYLKPKEMPEEMDNSLTSSEIKDDLKRGQYLKSYGKKIGATADWNAFLKEVDQRSEQQLATELLDTFLVNPPAAIDGQFLSHYGFGKDKQQSIKKMVINIMCLPEYQLC